MTSEGIAILGIAYRCHDLMFMNENDRNIIGKERERERKKERKRERERE